MRRAIIVQYYSESLYMPLWKKYYSPFFDYQERIEVDKKTYWNFQKVVQIINNKLEVLVRQYDVVAITDVDEFIVPNRKRYKNLGDYMDRMELPVVRPVGYNVIQMPDDEPLNIKRKITTQRKNWQRDKLYDKPMITRIPITLSPGKHICNIEDVPQDNDLRLFHLRDADLEYLVHGSGIVRSYQFKDRIVERQSKAELIPKEWKLL